MTRKTVDRVARFSLTVANTGQMARFYVETLGFMPGKTVRTTAAPYGVEGQATVRRLRLGQQEIELVGFDEAGASYPEDSTSHDGWFQHLALVTTDMAAAYARLSANTDWRTITTGGGPVTLPHSSGGVTAFKFRDPEGHPLELLEFPAGAGKPHAGIDHSAIVVAHAEQSAAFYKSLGLTVSSRSVNLGPEQDALDAAPDVQVDVTGLSPPQATPHIELLVYRTPAIRPGAVGPADIACTRSVLIPSDPAGAGRMLVDPDGHRVMLVLD
ncbi:MAG: VOC family protein [Janthinobacterium lividum]